MGDEDRAQLVGRGVEVLVDDPVVELRGVRHLLPGRRDALRDDRVAVLPAVAHARLQGVLRGRQDEDADGFGDLRTHLPGALPVDLEQHVLAGGQLRLDRLAGGALVVAMHQRVFEEVAGGDHPLELGLVDEVVVLGMALAGARRARRVADRQGDSGFAGQHGVDEARLAGAGRRGDDEQGAAFDGGRGCGGVGATGGSHGVRAPGVTRCSGLVRGPARSAPSARPTPG